MQAFHASKAPLPVTQHVQGLGLGPLRPWSRLRAAQRKPTWKLQNPFSSYKGSKLT